MRKLITSVFLIAVGYSLATAQNNKPWSEWDKKDVDKMLNNSAWGQTQTETDTSEMTFSPTSDSRVTGGNSNSDTRADVGARNQAVDVKFHVRLFSARPIREAFARNLLLANPNLKPSQLQNFVDGDYSEMIVVAVNFESADRRYSGPVGQAFASGTTDSLKNKAYLERSDGKKIYIDEYATPTNDNTGAKFVFPRVVDGKPFLSGLGESVRFYVNFGKGIEVSRRFKVADLTYNGKLEY